MGKRDMEWEKAKDSDQTLSDRASGVKNAAKNEMDHRSEDAKKKKEELKRENAEEKLKGNDPTQESESVAESVSNYVSETAGAIGDYLSGAAGQSEHKAKSEAHKEARDANWEKAKDSDQSLSERASGVKKAAGREVDHLSHEAKKKKDEQKKEHAKNKLTGN